MLHWSKSIANNAGDISLLATNAVILNGTRIDASSQYGTAGDVTITLTGDAVWSFSLGPITFNAPFSPIAAKFSMDEHSSIKGKDVTIDVTPTKTAMLDFANIAVEQDSIFAELVSGFNDIADNLIGQGNDEIDEVLAKIFEKLHGKIETAVVEASINIDGTIKATNDIVVTATANASAEIKNSNKGLSWSFAFVSADSEITIGEHSLIKAANNVQLTSEAKTTIKQTEEAGSADSGIFANYDVALGLGIARSSNTITIDPSNDPNRIQIDAGNDILINATTTRSHSLSVSGGKGGSYMGLVVGVLVGNADTDVIVDGVLKAENDINISAKTDTKDNVVSTIAEMRGKKEGDTSEDEPKKIDVASANAVKDATTDLLSNFVPGDTNSGSGGSNNKFGAAGAVSVMVDNVSTNVAFGGSILAEGNVSISAETVNEVMMGAFSHIGEYNETNKENAVALSVPVVVMNNSTTAVVQSGAEITATSGNIYLTTETRIPFNENASENVLYQLVNKIINYRENALKLLEFVQETAAGQLLDDLISGEKGVYDLIQEVAGGKELDTWLDETFAGAKETIQSMKEMIADLKDKENIGQLFGLLQERYTAEFNGLLEQLSNGTKSVDDFVSAVGELAEQKLTSDDIKNWVTKTSLDAVTESVIVQDMQELITALKNNQKNINDLDLVDDLKVKKDNIGEFVKNTKSDIRELFKRAKNDSGIDDIKTIIEAFQDGDKGNYFGLLDGLLNTWGQSSTETENVGAAAMVTYLDINNRTVAQIEEGTFTATNLNVEAKTIVELANLVGALAAVAGNDEKELEKRELTNTVDRSQFKYLPKNDYNVQWLRGARNVIEGHQEDNTTTADGGVIGGAILLSSIDSTTIARIDGGVFTVSGGDITVNAETKGTDIGIAIGGGNSGAFGVNFMANPSFYDSYTLAKIDDAVEVTAQNVTITANDTAYRIGVAGSLTGSSALSVGVSGAISVMNRNAHAVWGNLLEKDAHSNVGKNDGREQLDYSDTDAKDAEDSFDMGGADSTLNIDRKTSVTVGDHAFLGIEERPNGNDSINITANATIVELDNQSALQMMPRFSLTASAAFLTLLTEKLDRVFQDKLT